VPGAIAGTGVDQVVTARADYGRLDRVGADARIRLRSSVVRVRHLGPPDAGTGVEITYADGARLRSVVGRAVILACWHSVIPYLCPELPAEQRKAMAFETKVPLVYTNVLIRNWTAFQRLGIRRLTCPTFWHTELALDFPVSIGSYRFARSPSEPVVVHLSKAACQPGLPARDQHRAGRQELYRTRFATIERDLRRQLGRILGPGGFDPARDIVAITVNRWPHGYAYQYNSLFDDFWVNGGEPPFQVARRRYGRIAIANADAAAYAYTDAAIDQGARAAEEIATLG
jgi:spermidine dehydrogenase